MKREAWNHRVEQVARQWSFKSGGDAPRRAVEPDLAKAVVHRGGKQKPNALDAARVTTNRARIDIRPRGENVHGDKQVVRTHCRQISSDEIRAFVCEPVSEKRTAIVRCGRVARIDLHHDLSYSR